MVKELPGLPVIFTRCLLIRTVGKEGISPGRYLDFLHHQQTLGANEGGRAPRRDELPSSRSLEMSEPDDLN